MFIDTHAHLNFEAFKNDLDDVIKQSQQEEVENIINVGANLESSQETVNLAKKYTSLFSAIGFHPHHADEFNDDTYQQLLDLGKETKVVAIGETGLDYYNYKSLTKPGSHPKELQKKVFLKQVELAQVLNLPLVIHSRDSIEDLLPLVVQLYKQYGESFRGVFHCFSYDQRVAQKLIEIGFFISFTPILTYPKNDYLREVAGKIPLEKILLETDSPFLPPQNMRGLRNTPSTVKIVAQTIAEIRKISILEVAHQTTKNAQILFNLK